MFRERKRRRKRGEDLRTGRFGEKKKMLQGTTGSFGKAIRARATKMWPKGPKGGKREGVRVAPVGEGGGRCLGRSEQWERNLKRIKPGKNAKTGGEEASSYTKKGEDSIPNIKKPEKGAANQDGEEGGGRGLGTQRGGKQRATVHG